MNVVQILVVAYAKNIIQHGNRSFQTIAPNYVQPVKQHIANDVKTYPMSELDNALIRGYITEEEYTEILSLRTVIES